MICLGYHRLLGVKIGTTILESFCIDTLWPSNSIHKQISAINSYICSQKINTKRVFLKKKKVEIWIYTFSITIHVQIPSIRVYICFHLKSGTEGKKTLLRVANTEKTSARHQMSLKIRKCILETVVPPCLVFFLFAPLNTIKQA